jgi:hypothetical protein
MRNEQGGQKPRGVTIEERKEVKSEQTRRDKNMSKLLCINL